MTMKPKTPCKHPDCAALVPLGQKYCDRHKALHPDKVRSAASRGYGAAWQRARKQYLEVHPAVCGVHEGRTVREGNGR